MPVRESLNVLLVDGHFKSEPYQAETDYLAQALAPSEESPGQPRPIQVEVVSESQLSRRELAPYDVVVLCNVAQFSQPEVTALDDFLKQGGGVVVFGGDQVVADNYNRLLYDDGKGLLPAAIGPSVGDAAKKEAGFFFNPLGYRHPDRRRVSGRDRPGHGGADPGAHLAISQAGAPQGLEGRGRAGVRQRRSRRRRSRTRHRGTVILVATSADTGWTTWPIHKSYLPVMQQIVLRASAGRLSERNIRVGQPFDQSFPAAGAGGRRSRWSRPRGSRSRPSSKPAGGVSQFHFEQTDSSGAYQVKDRPAAGARIVVRRQHRPGRERPDQARPRGSGRDPAGLEFPLSDQLERIDRRCQLGRPPRRAAPPAALRPLDPAPGRIDPGVEIRAP